MSDVKSYEMFGKLFPYDCQIHGEDRDEIYDCMSCVDSDIRAQELSEIIKLLELKIADMCICDSLVYKCRNCEHGHADELKQFLLQLKKRQSE